MRNAPSTRSTLALVAVVLGIGWAAMPADAQPMVGLGTLLGYSDSQALAVSADGSTVVGSSGNQAFVWSAATGMVGLGNLPFPDGALETGSYASGVSGDGSMVVGGDYAIYYLADIDDLYTSVEAFVWTPETGRVGLGGLPGSPPQHGTSSPHAFATAMSADGSTVVGAATNAQGALEPFAWTAATGMVGLGTLPGATYSLATGVSADGSTIVGHSGNNVSPNYHQAFIWTATTGMVGLGHLPSALGPYSFANAVSADGSMVVGRGINSQGQNEAFVWTATTGMVGLGHLSGEPSLNSWANGVSADGSTVVGGCDVLVSDLQAFSRAFVWTAATGMKDLGSLPGATIPFSVASSVSADGSIVVGMSVNAEGFSEAFVLRLQPSPAELILALIEQVKGLNLKHGIANSLDAKLDAARQALGDVNNHNNVAAVNALNAFISAVRAQSGKAIPTTDADALIASATIIINLLQ